MIFETKTSCKSTLQNDDLFKVKHMNLNLDITI